MFLIVLATIFSFVCVFGTASNQVNLVPESVSTSINQNLDLSTQTIDEEKNIILFSGWSPKVEKESFLIKKIQKLLEKSESNHNTKEKKPNIIDLTNNYKKQEKNSLKPVFDLESSMKQNLELLKQKKKVILIGYSEGNFNLLQTLLKIINNYKENGLIEELPNFLEVYFIDFPLENFFNHVISIHSFVFWLVGTTADWVQWISGVSCDSNLNDRKFPFFGNLFLWGFRQFWKFFLVPSTCSSMKSGLVFGEDAMFNRTLFAKERAIENEKALNSVSEKDAKPMKEIITFYLQDWQKEKNRKTFESVGKIIDLPNNKKLNHLSIISPALKHIFNQF